MEEEEEGASGLSSPIPEEDLGRQHGEDELAGCCGGSDGSWGVGSAVCCCEGAGMMEEALFAVLSFTESLQAHWHWQDSSCLMMMTGRLRPICCTELPEKETDRTQASGCQ